MSASSIIQIDFGHRTVDITVGDVRSWRPWTEDTVTAACKALRLKADHEGARQCVRDIIDDVASQTPGCESFTCRGCGAQTYGAEGVIGSEHCTECDELAGWDNYVNDSGESCIMDDDTRETVRGLLKAIEANGGNPVKALLGCDFLIASNLNTGENS
jgi:hypothetical protein